MRLRLLSYNVHGLRDDRAALVDVVRAAAPDLVILQEAPRRFRWRARSAALAGSFGLYIAGGGLPALGNLVLAGLRVRVREEWCVQYPLTPGRHLRGAALVRCEVAGTRFVVAGSHLATDAGERPVQAAVLRRTLGEMPEPLVLGLDVNETAEGSAWRTLVAGGALVDVAAATGRDGVATFPVPEPRRRIDAVLVDPRWEILGYRVFDPPAARRASDHYPLLVDLRLP